jgi:hypothetical protein
VHTHLTERVVSVFQLRHAGQAHEQGQAVVGAQRFRPPGHIPDDHHASRAARGQLVFDRRGCLPVPRRLPQLAHQEPKNQSLRHW